MGSLEGFLLSPGITPAITDAALIVYLLGPGIGALVGGRRGLVVGFAAVSVLVAAIKLVTDWFDLWDDIVSIAGLVAPLLLVRAEGRVRARLPPHVSWLILGAGAVAVGFVKVLGDFYDPFDLLVGVSAILGGLGLLRSWSVPGDAGATVPPGVPAHSK